LIAPRPPASEAELLRRAESLVDKTVRQLADVLDRVEPPDLVRAKGWLGELIEVALGASAGNQARPDFPGLGIELKTLPVDAKWRPIESTFVTSAHLLTLLNIGWRESPVRHKLARVLWIPVEGEANIPLSVRRIGPPLLWSPSPEEDRALESDWDELVGLVRAGQLEALTAHRGRWLQVRPKGADGRARTQAVGVDGRIEATNPRGFYLRRQFTARLPLVPLGPPLGA
jgi:DNA mismatch repair protein MutH